MRKVASADNLADALTRVPTKWLVKDQHSADRTVFAGVGMVHDARGKSPSISQLRDMHRCHHFGVDRTLELARERFGDCVSRKSVRKVVSRCEECSRIDPAVNMKWKSGHVTVNETWFRLAVDIVHVKGSP